MTAPATGPHRRPQPDLFGGGFEQYRVGSVAGGLPVYRFVSLEEFRRALDVTQVELAARLGVNQPAVSKLERSHDPRLSTMRNYLGALGASLRLTAVLPDGTEVPLALAEPTPG